MTRCICCITSKASPRAGLQCLNPAKDGSDFCGLHRQCKQVQPCPKQAVLDDPLPLKKTVLKQSEVDPYSTCINQEDPISLESIRETVSRDNLIQVPPPPENGYCFDINDLAETVLASGNRKNPFTRESLWETDQQFEKIILHPKLKESLRTFLKLRFNPDKITAENIQMLTDNYDLFTLIGEFGIMLLDESITPECHTLLEIIPLDHPIWQLHLPTYRTLFDILYECDRSPIETGFNLLATYIYYWYYSLRSLKLPLIDRLTQIPDYRRAFFARDTVTDRVFKIYLNIVPDLESQYISNGYNGFKYRYRYRRLLPITSDDYFEACKDLNMSPRDVNSNVTDEEHTFYPEFYIWKTIYLYVLENISYI